MQKSRHSRGELPPAEEKAKFEAGVLTLLLAEYPTQMTIAEVIKGMHASLEVFDEREPIERAVRDLVAVGLLHRHGEFVFPTRAALRRDELPM